MANQAPEKTAEYILSLVLQGSTWTPPKKLGFLLFMNGKLFSEDDALSENWQQCVIMI